MKKIAIFVEGQSEQIFVRSLLERVFDLSTISFECQKIYRDQQKNVLHNFQNPGAKVHFLIVDVGNDERVLTAVKERHAGLVDKGGYEQIIAFRDMYSEAYDRRAKGRIDDEVTREFNEGAKKTIQNMKHASKITVHFAVMELEAWFLGMHSLLKRIFTNLTDEVIERELQSKLADIDPQTRFYKPSIELNRILEAVNHHYDKSRDVVEKICSTLTQEDIAEATNNNRCASFFAFFNNLNSCCN